MTIKTENYLVNFGMDMVEGGVKIFCVHSGNSVVQLTPLVPVNICKSVADAFTVAKTLGYTPFVTSSAVEAIASIELTEGTPRFVRKFNEYKGYDEFFVSLNGKRIYYDTLEDYFTGAISMLRSVGSIYTDTAHITLTGDGETCRVTNWTTGEVLRVSTIEGALGLAEIIKDEDMEVAIDEMLFGDILFDEEDEPTAKECSKCGVEKPLSEFYPQADSYLGHRADCIECKRAADHKRRQVKRMRAQIKAVN